VITHHLKGNKIKDWVKQYQENETFRKNKRKDSILLSHEIISFNKSDTRNLSLEKMEAITREYIRIRSPKAVVTAASHHDKDHFHVHLAISTLEYRNGKSLRLSKTELSKLKCNIQKYQIENYPELASSVVKHGMGNKNLTDAEFQMKMRNNRITDKEQVLELLNTCFNKAKSKEDFFIKLQGYGLSTYTRSGKLTGLVYKNKKHRLGRLGFTEEKLNKLNLLKNRSLELDQIREKQQKTRRHDINRTQ
jgi:hypothetical protein